MTGCEVGTMARARMGGGLLRRVRMDEFVAHADSRGLYASDLLRRCLTLDGIQDLARINSESLAQGE